MTSRNNDWLTETAEINNDMLTQKINTTDTPTKNTTTILQPLCIHTFICFLPDLI